MVHVKRVELTNFKSFGGTTSVPLLPGFTVISGPNGSGKSNILDALLFCLGLSSSKGMRADRLPDLVNNTQVAKGRGRVEASVTVTFDLEGGGGSDNDWSVTRRLRVTREGSYTSSYYMNGAPCNLTELHEQLNNLRIYPEGYNVVLQGDVTSIISMSSRERREIIDELAGVAAFDRKINQAKKTLDEVKEKEDSCRIIETELTIQRDRLSHDRIRAEKYQNLRAEFLSKQSWEVVLSWRSLQLRQENLVAEIQRGDTAVAELTNQLGTLNLEIAEKTAQLAELNAYVKALGEEELLRVQGILIALETEFKQVQRQERELLDAIAERVEIIRQNQVEIANNYDEFRELGENQVNLLEAITRCEQERSEAQEALDGLREAAAAMALASEAWVQEQGALNRKVEGLLQILEPWRTEEAQLRERSEQLQRLTGGDSELIANLELGLKAKGEECAGLEAECEALEDSIKALGINLSGTEGELEVEQETQRRLLQEQREKQRQLDKLEAQAQARQEVQGTEASKVILRSGLRGLCGLVVQLGKVDVCYQLALETAAGGRLGYIVVDDDTVAAAGIELLKQKRAGRATFLPLNKVKVSKLVQDATLGYVEGFVDYAVNLVECDRRYRDVFSYVFGNTVVFTDMQTARPNMGLYRIVTLEGELLETSGAMTGGRSSQRSVLRFGNLEGVESEEVRGLKNRLSDIEEVLQRSMQASSNLSIQVKRLREEFTGAQQLRREKQLQLSQLQREVKGFVVQLEGTQSQLAQNTARFAEAQERLEVLQEELPKQEFKLLQLKQRLSELEGSQTPVEWREIQGNIKIHEQELQQKEQGLREAEARLNNSQSRRQRLQERIEEAETKIAREHKQQQTQQEQVDFLKNQGRERIEQIDATRSKVREMEAILGSEKQRRDSTEAQLRSLVQNLQQLEWEGQKLGETQEQRLQELEGLQFQLGQVGEELPNPLPDVPKEVNLDQLQRDLRSLSKRLQSMEPVNMLALEEYERTDKRLQELTQKLETLAEERTELLLRIENFTTLRQLAFKEAFDAVNENFQSIFAILSEGDGYLQLENPEDFFNSGLNLVAHPKGKPVQRLASMSGGEKSLTALSFIFALQRYRPSPFYAFDEVDMFLDGANVERLAKMIKQQSHQAQFIVVSLRRPMIESAQRTIGVTQARGAYTQVLGIKLQSSNTSA